jgi:hypothetical protein
MTITVYMPDSEARPDVGALAPSPTSLASLRIAVLDNGKPNAVTVMARAAETLAERTGATVSLVVKKGPGGRSANAAIPCADDIFARLLEEADVVITGAADCGSCTAYSVFDAIALEKAGHPAVVVTTTKFAPIASTMAADFGMPDVRTLVLPHPLGGTDRDTLWGWADAAAERLEALFLGTAAPERTAVSAAAGAAGESAVAPGSSERRASLDLHDSVRTALPSIQALVEADRSWFNLDDVSSDGAVRLTLEFTDEACEECVMPRALLEQTATRVLQAAVPGVRRIDITDPRES